MIKKLVGFCLILTLFAGNGQFLYAFENNINLNLEQGNDFREEITKSLNNARSLGEDIRDGFEMGYGLLTGSTIVVGPNEEHKNLKDAVANSKNGDTILLVPGNYTSNDNLNLTIDHNLTIKSSAPFKQWINYNNTNYTYKEYYEKFGNNSDENISNNSFYHQENAVMINGGGKSQIFNILSNSSLKLEGLFLMNGSSLKGGAIYNKGKLKINDSYFNDNEVFDDNVRDQEKGGGGAIYNEGELEMSLTDFMTNKADDYQKGGAIYNTGTMTQLNNCSFKSNYADNGGGAIYNNGKIEPINNNLFAGNVADSTTSHCGGALLDEGNDIIDFNRSTFVYNFAKSGGGGAVDSYSSGIKFHDSNFIFNSAQTYGGALRSLNAETLDLTNSSFKYNTAGNQGGSVYYTGNDFNSSYNNFTGNVAEHDGGGLYLGSCRNSIFHNNNFTMNVGDNGGAIYHNGGSMNIDNNTFMFNSANGTISNGGAIYTENGVFNTDNNTFDRNNALGDGGALYNKNSKGLINSSIFHENICQKNGGAVYNNHFNVSLNNCSVYNNYAIGNGGALYNNKEGTNFLVKQTLFANNTANDNGGSVCNLADSFFTYFSAFTTSKTVTGDGGAIYNDGSNINMELCDFQYNFAQGDGGGIYNNGKTIRTTNVNITGNGAHGYGGGYYDESNWLQAELTNFKDNSAGKAGNDFYTASKKEAVAIGVMVGLALILVVITVLSIVIPAAAGLYSFIGVAAASAGWSAGVASAAVYGVQALIAIVAGFAFMGIEEAISSACPEFEDWNSEYWYVTLIVFVFCAVTASFITEALTQLVINSIRSGMEVGVLYGQVCKGLAAMAEEIVDATAFLPAGGKIAFVFSKIAKLVGILFQRVHLDDFIVGIIASSSTL
ncbi:MAG: hypothetical protein LBB45_08570 [Methanobrevibacter sp.]|jgi:predicted outer membrane repeat protein|nr:hypothetical protein [Candidatus Methanovirga basalitermitum]